MLRNGTSHRGFTLIELLVVVGIIGLLVGILLPSMKSARNAAKKAKVTAQIKGLGEGLQQFYGANDDYPDSSKRRDPADVGGASPCGDDPLGREIENPGNGTLLWGAQMLARAMVGRDFKGYVNPREARAYNRRWAPTEWYDIPGVDPATIPDRQYPRKNVYISETAAFWRTAAPPSALERSLGGLRPEGITDANNQWVVVDVFERPILYYKADPNGTILCDATSDASDSEGMPVYDPENIGIPFYNMLDNDIFTGTRDGLGVLDGNTTDLRGWRFGSGLQRYHQIRDLGAPVEPHELPPPAPPEDEAVTNTFAKYIHDHRTEGASSGVIKPHNPDSYLLISAGIDGFYGTNDDITNFDSGRKE